MLVSETIISNYPVYITKIFCKGQQIFEMPRNMGPNMLHLRTNMKFGK